MVVPPEMRTEWREERSPLWRGAHTEDPCPPPLGRAERPCRCKLQQSVLTPGFPVFLGIQQLLWETLPSLGSISPSPCSLTLCLNPDPHPPILSPVTPKRGSLILSSLRLGPYFVATSSALSLVLALFLPTPHYSISFTSLTLTFLLPHYFAHLAST